MLDLRRIDGGELRERLGEKLGAKVLMRTAYRPTLTILSLSSAIQL